MRKILLATAAGFAAWVANGATSAPAYAQAAQATGQTPQPGLTLSTTGRIRFHGAIIGQDGSSADNGRKLSNYDFNTYGRVRFDLSGVNQTGLIYGGRIEARIAPQSGAPSGNANVFLRVVNGFIGTPTLGQIRFGSNGVLAVPQMYVGHIMGSVGTGLLDGDVSDYFFTGQGGVIANSFWYSASGNVNRATGIGYYSPQFAGFDFGISYAANESAFLGGCNVSNANFESCDRASTVNANGDRKLRNIIDAMVRYRGTFGGVGIAASGGVRTADYSNTIAPAVAAKNPTVGIVGAEVSFAGFTIGGITSFGSVNRGFASGGSALPKTGNNDGMFSWQLGARYTLGAFTVGAAYHELKTEGALNVPADLKERGFGIGGTYALGPGLSLVAEYVYSHARENGRDFIDNNLRAGNQEKFKAQAFLFGVMMGF